MQDVDAESGPRPAGELLSGDNFSMFTDDEMVAIETWLSEADEMNAALVEGMPIWQLMPVERILNLDDERRKEALADPDRMPLELAEADEEEMPLLRVLRLSEGQWIDDERRKRLVASGYSIDDAE
jgi:hypothetical protein